MTGGKCGFFPNLDISIEISFASPVVLLKFQSFFSRGTSRMFPENRKIKFCFFCSLKKHISNHF